MSFNTFYLYSIALASVFFTVFFIMVNKEKEPYRVRCEGGVMVIERPYDTIVDRQPGHHLCLPKE